MRLLATMAIILSTSMVIAESGHSPGYNPNEGSLDVQPIIEPVGPSGISPCAATSNMTYSNYPKNAQAIRHNADGSTVELVPESVSSDNHDSGAHYGQANQIVTNCGAILPGDMTDMRYEIAGNNVGNHRQEVSVRTGGTNVNVSTNGASDAGKMVGWALPLVLILAQLIAF